MSTKACGAMSSDERRCYLPMGHAPPHAARCGTCGEHHWPEPERDGTHAEALRADVVYNEHRAQAQEVA